MARNGVGCNDISPFENKTGTDGLTEADQDATMTSFEQTSLSSSSQKCSYNARTLSFIPVSFGNKTGGLLESVISIKGEVWIWFVWSKYEIRQLQIFSVRATC